VNREEAKQILSTYRSWGEDARCPEKAEALALCRQDPELAKWFEGHCAVQDIIHARLKSIPVPVGLKERILSGHKSEKLQTERQQPDNVVPLWRQPVVLAAAAVMVLLISIGSLWLRHYQADKEDLTFDGFRNRMVRQVVKAYGMDMESNDPATIRSFLASHKAYAEYVLPKALDQTASVGCGVLSWQGKPVTMVCFHSGKPLGPREKSDLYLFVVERSAVPNAPTGDQPEFSTAGKLATASWTSGDRVYVLAGTGDEAFLKRHL